MKEYPLICTAADVRAILAGTKRQDRHVIRGVFKWKGHDCIKDWDGGPSRLDMAPRNWEICPLGVPGDRLWVKEAMRRDHLGEFSYDADGAPALWPPTRERLPWPYKRQYLSAICMPRWACRLVLEITDVGVELDDNKVWNWVRTWKVMK